MLVIKGKKGQFEGYYNAEIDAFSSCEEATLYESVDHAPLAICCKSEHASCLSTYLQEYYVKETGVASGEFVGWKPK